jgi:hypothetical protein
MTRILHTINHAITTQPQRELILLLSAIASDPSRESLFDAAAYLDIHYPPARIADRHSSRIPGWFIKSWRSHNTDQPKGRDPFRALHELQEALGSRLDHWGTVYLAGIPALVSEPYNLTAAFSEAYPHNPAAESILQQLNAVATRAGALALFQRRSTHYPPHTTRLLWLPHPSRWRDATSPYGRRTFTH